MNKEHLTLFQLINLESKINAYLIIITLFVVAIAILFSRLTDYKTITLSLIFIFGLMILYTYILLGYKIQKVKEVLNE